MRTLTVLVLVLIAAPLAASAQKVCSVASDTVSMRQVVTPPLAGIRTVYVETTVNGPVDPYNANTKLAEWHVRKDGLVVVDALRRADAKLHVELIAISTAATEVTVSWERSYRNGAGHLRTAQVSSLTIHAPGSVASTDTQRMAEEAVVALLLERDWQNCTKGSA